MLPDIEFLVDSFFPPFSSLNISAHCHLSAGFQLRKVLIILLSIMCLAMGLSLSYLEFIQLFVFVYTYLSWNLGSFWPLFPQVIPLFLSLSFIFFTGTSIICVLVCLMMSHKSLRLYSLFFFFFFFFIRLDNFKWPEFKFADLFYLFWVCCWTLWWIFQFIYYIF